MEAAGRGEQVHGNSEIIAYACCSDFYSKLWLEEKIMLQWDDKEVDIKDWSGGKL